jgi:hypothetical protein
MGSPTSDPLDVDLSAGLAPEAQHSLVRALWGNNPAKWLSFHGAKSETDFNAYLKYHSQQCDLIALHNNGKYSTATTHRQIANIAALLRDPNSTRSSVLQQFPSLLRHGTLVQDENTLHLVSRLISMVRIGEVTHEFLAGRSLQWKDGSLSDFLRAHFSSTPVLGHERIKFEKTFNALSLSRIAGLEIQWADNLADHLRLVNDDCVLRVFHHATFLSSQRDQ